jgi:hypothetical protein
MVQQLNNTSTVPNKLGFGFKMFSKISNNSQKATEKNEGGAE